MTLTQKIYEQIKDFTAEHGYPPTGRQVAEAMGLDYETEVRPAIRKLINDGKIRISEPKSKIIESLD